MERGFYEHFKNGTEPKGLLRRFYYKLWLSVGVRPSTVFAEELGYWLQQGVRDEEVTP